MFAGVYTALITPFKNNSIDYDSLEAIIENQIEQGVAGLVPLGTTGESPTVSVEEHRDLLSWVVKTVNKRVTVVAGTGANATEEAIHLARSAQDSGADALLQVNPYYNKPTQKGLIEHFQKIAESVTLPIVLYNIPGRTGVNFMPESVYELIQRVDNIAAMKEASGDIAQMMHFYELCGDRVDLLSGDDNLLLPVLGIGGKGIVSVLANLLPGEMSSVVRLYHENKTDQARDLFYRLLPLCRAMFFETNPIPIKYAMHLAGYCTGELRLPMTELSDTYRETLKELVSDFGVQS